MCVVSVSANCVLIDMIKNNVDFAYFARVMLVHASIM